jgi:hypothetical protein
MENSISSKNPFPKYDDILSNATPNNPQPKPEDKLLQKQNDASSQNYDSEKMKTGLPGKLDNNTIKVAPDSPNGFKKFVMPNGTLAYQAVDNSANLNSPNQYKVGRYQVQSNDSKTGWKYLNEKEDKDLISKLDKASSYHQEATKTDKKGSVDSRQTKAQNPINDSVKSSTDNQENKDDLYKFVQSMNPNPSDTNLSSQEKQDLTQDIINSLSALHPSVPRGSIEIDKKTDRPEGSNSSPSDIIETSGLNPEKYSISDTAYAGTILGEVQKPDSKDQSQDITTGDATTKSYLTSLKDLAKGLQATGFVGHLDKLLQPNKLSAQTNDAVTTFLSDVSEQMTNDQNSSDPTAIRKKIVDAIEQNIVDFSLGEGVSETTGKYQGAEGAVIIANLAIKQKSEELMARGSDKAFTQDGISARDGKDGQKEYRFYNEGQREFYKHLGAGNDAKYAMKVNGKDAEGNSISSWKYVNDKSLIEKLDRVDSGFNKHLVESQYRIDDLPSALKSKTSEEGLAHIKRHYGAELDEKDLKSLEAKFAETKQSSKKEIAEFLASKTKNSALNRIYDLVYQEKKTQILNPEFAQKANSYNAARTAALTKIASLYSKDPSKFNEAIKELNLPTNSPERKWADKLKMDFTMSHHKFDERSLKQQHNFLKSVLDKPMNAKTADLLQYSLTALTGFYDIENIPGY